MFVGLLVNQADNLSGIFPDVQYYNEFIVNDSE